MGATRNLHAKQTARQPDSSRPGPKCTPDRALAFSLEGCELEAERGILESDGLVTAHQQPEEPEDK